MRARRLFVTAMAALLLLAATALPAAAQVDQDGLVNVSIGDVTILEEVDVALAAVVVANVCALVEANVLVLAEQVDEGTIESFECEQRGSGRAVAITDN